MDRSHGRRPSSGGAGTARRVALAVVGATVGLVSFGASPAAASGHDDADPPATAIPVVEAVCPTDDETVEGGAVGSGGDLPAAGLDLPPHADGESAAPVDDPGEPPTAGSLAPTTSWTFDTMGPVAPGDIVEVTVEIGVPLTLEPCVEDDSVGPASDPPPAPPADGPIERPAAPALLVPAVATAPVAPAVIPAPPPVSEPPPEPALAPVPPAPEQPEPAVAVLSSLACGPDELAVDLDADAVDDTCYDPTSVPWFDGHYPGREAPAATAGADALLEIVHAPTSAPAAAPPPAVVPSATTAPVELAHTGAGAVPLLPLGLLMVLLGTVACAAAGVARRRSVENLWTTRELAAGV